MLDSFIRTFVSKVVGAIVGLAVAVGVVVPADMSESLTVAVTGVVVGLVEVAYYVIGRAIERRFPKVGWVLLSLGLTRRTPIYTVPGEVVPGYAPGHRR